eukprot:TRINITY_DN14193_c0_g1_i2.p1 TRINITY_DN14193_c0_g1~~TRINITY_DN14193_c0_g1_i2.p1  ORF type:complete len:191 (-),score=31.72 TRINITY_DN14193_c0_g1_i2:62-634(-)
MLSEEKIADATDYADCYASLLWLFRVGKELNQIPGEGDLIGLLSGVGNLASKLAPICARMDETVLKDEFEKLLEEGERLKFGDARIFDVFQALTIRRLTLFTDFLDQGGRCSLDRLDFCKRLLARIPQNNEEFSIVSRNLQRIIEYNSKWVKRASGILEELSSDLPRDIASLKELQETVDAALTLSLIHI